MPEVLPQEFAFQHPASPGGDWPALVGTPDDEPSRALGVGGAGGGEAWPPGSVFMAIVPTSPAVLLGYGTWTPLAPGRVLIGHDGSGYNAGDEGGQEFNFIDSHPFIAQHSHGYAATTNSFPHNQVSGRQGTSAGNVLTTPSSHDHFYSGSTGLDSGVSLPDHSPTYNIQPYLVVYMWQRIG